MPPSFDDTPAVPAQRRILAAGDQAFVVEFGQHIERDLFARVMELDRHIHRLFDSGRLSGLIETVPTFRSLAVFFDPLETTPDAMLEVIDATVSDVDQTDTTATRLWRLPVCYDRRFAPDLESVATSTELSVDEVVAQHQSLEYTVYMLGFLPGFAFLGDVPAVLQLPRRTQPRTRVPAGSVAIANQLTAVYPWESPGGWHLLGRCPIPLFDAAATVPATLRAGDRIRFEAITAEEFQAITERLDKGSYDVSALLAS